MIDRILFMYGTFDPAAMNPILQCGSIKPRYVSDGHQHNAVVFLKNILKKFFCGTSVFFGNGSGEILKHFFLRMYVFCVYCSVNIVAHIRRKVKSKTVVFLFPLFQYLFGVDIGTVAYDRKMKMNSAVGFRNRRVPRPPDKISAENVLSPYNGNFVVK